MNDLHLRSHYEVLLHLEHCVTNVVYSGYLLYCP